MRYKFILLIATTFIGCTTIPDGYVKDSGGETIYKNVDLFRGATYYRHVHFFDFRSRPLELFYVTADGKAGIFSTYRYVYNAPIYLNKITIIDGTGRNKAELPVNPSDVLIKYSPQYEEYATEALPDAGALILYKIFKSGKASIRFSGRNGYHDVELEDETLKVNLDILEKYFKIQEIDYSAFK
ncbi:hypothetical protein [Leptospira meyeri]|uniref:hypothetical protein n=1 Tax=Leptospira meyeri TaxID=29508 RepID=UPI0010832619|nr:hypothetical protein [Leptospira meyeri]TGM22013.1 hypothetical protein EHQ73_09465 [Leptospira meyeri]